MAGLLFGLRFRIVLDWRKQQTMRAMVRYTIEVGLEELPEVYSQSLYQQKCDVLCWHFYEAMGGWLAPKCASFEAEPGGTPPDVSFSSAISSSQDRLNV